MSRYKIIIAFIVFCWGNGVLLGQSYYYIHDARSLALGGASSCLETGLHAAGMVGSDRKEIALSLSKWMSVPSLNHILVHATHPIGNFQLNGLANVITTSTYTESMFNVGGGLLLFRNMSLGVTLNYYGLAVSADDDHYDQGLQQAISANLALQYRPLSDLTIGFLVNNLVKTSFGSESDDFFLPPLYLALGVQYNILPDLRAVGELSQYQGERIQYRVGLEYDLFPHLPLRVGYYAPESSPTVGVGYYFSRFRLDASFDFNGRLGTRALLGFAYRW